MSKLRGAVIGCGFFAQNHLRAWGDISDVRLAAVCDVDPAKAKAAAELTGAVPYTDVTAMLAAEPLDFVDIATTMASHEPLVAQAAGAGVHVICQKPFAPDIAGVRRILATAEAAGIRVMVHENFRYQTPMIELKAAMAGIGEPFFAHVSWRTGFDVAKRQPYLAEVERFILLDLGIHVLDIARFLMGEVTDLCARNQSTMAITKADSAAAMSLRHASGAVSEVVCSYTTRIDPDPFPQTLVEIEGSAGTLHLAHDYRLELHRPGRLDVTSVAPKTPAWADPEWAMVQESVLNTQAHFAECLRSGAEFQTSGRDNLKTFALVEAAYASAASGQPVVPEA